MTIAAATIQTKIEAAVTAQEAGDYATALKNLRSAKLLLSGLPNIQSGDANIGWDRASIDSMIAELEQLRHAAAAESSDGPFQNSAIVYQTEFNTADPRDWEGF